MNRCEKCNVELDIIDNCCPLCGSEVKTNKDSTYPRINYHISSHLIRKIIFFICCLISVSIVLINYYFTPDIKWSLFVILQLFLTFIIFFHILNGKNKIISLLLVLNFLICGISFFWDMYIGFKGWSINYVFPSLCGSFGIFILILRFVNYFAFYENSLYIYLNLLLCFIPIILLYFGKISSPPLSIISAVVGLLNILILIIFDGSKFKKDLEKKLHI